MLLENCVSGGVPVYLKIRGILDVQGSQLKISPFFSCPNALLSRSFSVFIVLEMYNFGLNKSNVASLFDRPFVRDFEKNQGEKKIGR